MLRLIQRPQVQDLPVLAEDGPQGRLRVAPLVVKHGLRHALVVVLRVDTRVYLGLADLLRGLRARQLLFVMHPR